MQIKLVKQVDGRINLYLLNVSSTQERLPMPPFNGRDHFDSEAQAYRWLLANHGHLLEDHASGDDGISGIFAIEEPYVCLICGKSLKYKQSCTPHDLRMCEDCYEQHILECEACKDWKRKSLLEERTSCLEELAALDRKIQLYS